MDDEIDYVEAYRLLGVRPSTKKGGDHEEASQTPVADQRNTARRTALDRLTRKAGTASSRLRHRLSKEEKRYAEPGRLLIEGGRTAELWPLYLGVAYHVARGAIVSMESAWERCMTRGFDRDPVAIVLAQYLARHITEEMHESNILGPGGAIMDDLRSMGKTPQICPTRLDHLFKQLDKAIWQEHPVAILGMLQLERFHPTNEAVERLIQSAPTLPRSAFMQMILHTELDVEHVWEMDNLLDTLPLHPWQQDLVTNAAVMTLTIVRDSLLEVVK